MSERTFRRWRDRFEAEGADGSLRPAPGPGVGAPRGGGRGDGGCWSCSTRVYWDFTAKHFPREAGGASMDFKRSYNWLRLTLQAHGRVRRRPGAGRTGASGRRRPMVGMMLHQDGSSHEWVAGQIWDLIVTLDDATVGDLLGVFRRGGRHDVEFPGAHRGDRRARAVLFALCRPGVALLAHARGRRQGRQGQPDPGRPGPGPARHRADRGLFSGGAGPLGAHVRDPAGAPAPGAARWPGSPPWTRPTGSCEEVYLAPNTMPASPGRPEETRLGLRGHSPAALEDILCVQEERVVGNDNTVRYKGRVLQIPADRHRHHYVKARVGCTSTRTAPLAVFHGPRRLARYTGRTET